MIVLNKKSKYSVRLYKHSGVSADLFPLSLFRGLYRYTISPADMRLCFSWREQESALSMFLGRTWGWGNGDLDSGSCSREKGKVPLMDTASLLATLSKLPPATYRQPCGQEETQLARFFLRLGWRQWVLRLPTSTGWLSVFYFTIIELLTKPCQVMISSQLFVGKSLHPQHWGETLPGSFTGHCASRGSGSCWLDLTDHNQVPG